VYNYFIKKIIKNKMNKNKIIVAMMFAVMFLGSFLEINHVQAQSAVGKQAIMVAAVDIYNPSIVSQENNKLKISFDIYNEQGVQPEIKYAVQLVKSKDQKQSLVDQVVYDEVISLREGEVVNKGIDYIAPEFLSGDFSVMLMAKNASGLILAMASVGDIKLNGNGQYVEILNDSCYITIDGDTSGKRYFLYEGVDISSSEKLKGNCQVWSHLAEKTELTPTFKTYWRNSFGRLIKAENGQSLVLNPNEKKQIIFDLPKTDIPQAYDIVANLVDAQQKEISNQVTFHYVLQGQSATIQNLRLDKDYYSAGETAKLSFFWASSADAFMGSRVGKGNEIDTNLEISITDGQGNSCIDPLVKKLSVGDNVIDLPVEMKRDCKDPQINVIIKDTNGAVLDQKMLTIKSQTKHDTKVPVFVRILPTIIIILAILLLAYVYIKRKNRGIISILFFLLVSGFIFTGHEKVVKAYTFSNGDMGVYIQSLSKFSYSPGESIVAYGVAFDTHCANSGRYDRIEWAIDDMNYSNLSFRSAGTYPSSYDVATKSAPNETGLHSVNYRWSVNEGGSYWYPEGSWSQEFYVHSSYLTFVGECGADNGQTFTTNPPDTAPIMLSGTLNQVNGLKILRADGDTIESYRVDTGAKLPGAITISGGTTISGDIGKNAIYRLQASGRSILFKDLNGYLTGGMTIYSGTASGEINTYAINAKPVSKLVASGNTIEGFDADGNSGGKITFSDVNLRCRMGLSPDGSKTSNATQWLWNCRTASTPEATVACSANKANTLACTGADPVNSTICPGDDSGLTSNTPKTLVTSCTDATKCEYIPTMSGTLTPSAPSCVIPEGASTCTVDLSWSITNPIGIPTAITASGITNVNVTNTLATPQSGTASSLVVPWGGRTFYLYNNAILLAQSTVSASSVTCTIGAYWDGTKCATGAINGYYSDWGACDATCHQTAINCVPPQNGGLACPDPAPTQSCTGGACVGSGACSSPAVHYKCLDDSDGTNKINSPSKWSWDCGTTSCSQKKSPGYIEN